MKIFVYGTLLQGMSRAKVLENSQFIGIGFTFGKLYDLGSYPALNPGEDTVFGELYQINDEKLNELDCIEGYSPNNEMHALYLRKEINVVLLKDRTSEIAYTYFYNDDLSGNAKKIDCGDYRRFLLEKNEGWQWYIAYGSNMSTQRLINRIEDYSEIKKGYLKGYQLVFNKQAENNKETYANISYTGLNHQCPFVAYRVTLNQLKDLDKHEGEPNHYKRIGFEFIDMQSGTAHLGQIYIANTKQLTNQASPTKEYLNHIFNGYQEHGFDTQFLPKIPL